MFTRDRDFVVENTHGILRCQPKTAEVASAFKVLQLAVQRTLPQIPDAPPVAIELDGVIGPSLVLGVQVIAQRLAEGRYPELSTVAEAQPEQAIPMVAEGALEIAGYISNAVEKTPAAILAPQTTLDAPPDFMSVIRTIFTGKRIIAGTAVLLGLGAIVAISAMTDRRSLGIVDRSGMLPPSDGTDEFDETDEAADDDSEDDAGDHSGRIIDTTATEVRDEPVST